MHTRGYVLMQDDRALDPERYLTSINDIKQRTGFDFLSALDDETENRVEAARPTTLWQD